MPRFGDGVYTVVPTPFTEKGSVDLKSLEQLTDFLVGLGIDGLQILGVMGEAPKLAGAERTKVGLPVDVVLQDHPVSSGVVLPEILRDVVRAHRAGDTREAAETFYRYLPLIRFEFQDEIGPAIRKRIYRLRGVIGHDAIRQPGTELDDCSAQQLDDLLSWLRLLEGV